MALRDSLRDMFPNKPLNIIDSVVELVESETPNDPYELQVDTAIEILVQDQPDGIRENDNEDNLLDEASGQARPILTDNELSQFYDQLLNVFPDACETYVRDLCVKNSRRYCNVDDLMDEMSLMDYPKRKMHPKEVFEQLKEMLPNAHLAYLEDEAKKLANMNVNDLKEFVENAIEKGDYPTMEVYLKNQKKMEEISQYTDNFNIEAFLKLFPDPEKHFSDPNLKCPFTTNINTEKKETNEEHQNNDEEYATIFLYNHYNYLRKKDIDRVFRMCSKNLFMTCTRLDTMRKAFSSPRKLVNSDITTDNTFLLQLIAYLKNRKVIKKRIKEYDARYRMLREEAINNGLLQTCACCFDDELIPEECFFCKNYCIFCKDCVKKGAETVIGLGKLEFPCLADCGSEYSIPTLQMVLDSVVFSRMAQRKQMDEVKRANIDGLETCPFCDFAAIPAPDSKIFNCLNVECMKESCRECRHISHIPLRCEEIEYDEDVKMRTYIENKMTEALLRKCWKCNKVFIKSSGCNKMTCNCGAQMCYVCGEAVSDYRHFGENGRCPLYTNDLNKFHTDAVVQGANRAKMELGVDKNPRILKNDPSRDLAV